MSMRLVSAADARHELIKLVEKCRDKERASESKLTTRMIRQEVKRLACGKGRKKPNW